jgi:hypothetical protein
MIFLVINYNFDVNKTNPILAEKLGAFDQEEVRKISGRSSFLRNIKARNYLNKFR